MIAKEIKNIIKSYLRTIKYDKYVYIIFTLILIAYFYINSAVNNNYLLQHQRYGSLADIMISSINNIMVVIPLYTSLLLYGFRNERKFQIRIKYQENKMRLRIIIIGLFNALIFISISFILLMLIGSFFCRYFINFDLKQSEYFVQLQEINNISFLSFTIIFLANYSIRILWNTLMVCVMYIKKVKPMLIMIIAIIFNLFEARLYSLIPINIFGTITYDVYKEYQFVYFITAIFIMIIICKCIINENKMKISLPKFNKFGTIKWIPIILLTLFSLQNFNNTCKYYINKKIQITIGDALLHVLKGAGNVSITKITQINFVWIFLFVYFGVLLCQKIKSETVGIGVQKMIRYEYRYEWWSRQILDVVKLTKDYYVCIFCVSFCYCSLFGKLSLVPTMDIQQLINQFEFSNNNLLSIYIQAILIPYFILVTIGLIVLAVSEVIGTLQALILYIVLILLPIFYEEEIIIRFLMLENNGLINYAAKSIFNINHMIICLVLVIVASYIGFLHFNKKDIFINNINEKKR